jgi:hypothetical protein
MYEVLKTAELIVKEIDDEIKQLEERLGAGDAKNYEEYCRMCGVITGLLTSRRYITDLTKNMESHDD